MQLLHLPISEVLLPQLQKMRFLFIISLVFVPIFVTAIPQNNELEKRQSTDEVIPPDTENNWQAPIPIEIEIQGVTTSRCHGWSDIKCAEPKPMHTIRRAHKLLDLCW